MAERSDVRWTAVALEVPETLTDELVARVQGITHGIRVETTATDRCALWIYLADEVPATEALALVEAALDLHGIAASDCLLRLETIEDGHWVERFQASLQPFDLGRRFTVFPSGVGEARESREPLYLVPGRAFGTGEHPTTQLCVEMLERHVAPGSRWVDLGCGTGVLSMAARGCGAEHVLAIDDDPDAVEVAREVLGRNGVIAVEVLRNSGLPAAAAAPDGIVANIGAAFFRESCATLADRLTATGLLIASGILAEDLVELEPRFETVGLSTVQRETRGPWAVLVARRVER